MSADKEFPIPVSGQPIPSGWFARLVRFMNGLRVHGDGRYVMVSQGPSGRTVSLSPALLQALGRTGTPPGSGSPVVAATGFPDYTHGSPFAVNTSYQITGGDVWIGGSVTINPGGTGLGGYAQLIVSASAYGTALFDPVLLSLSQSGVELKTGFLYPARAGQHVRIERSSSAVVVDAYSYPCVTSS